MKKYMKNLFAVCVLAGGITGSDISAAASESENNDTFAAANTLSSGALTGTIGDGTLDTASNDVDMFRFGLASGGSLSASISSVTSVMQTANTDLELILVLWNSAFQSVADNPWNNTSNGSLNYTSASGGTYYLSVTARANTPLDIFGNPLSDGQGAGFYFEGWSLDHWSDQSFIAGQYALNISGAIEPPPAVPVPPAVWLFGSGLLGLAGVARRKNNLSA
jgi:hypothetical protein